MTEIESGLLRIGLEYVIWIVRSIFIGRKSIYVSSVNPFLEKNKVHIWTVSPYISLLMDISTPAPPGPAGGTDGRDGRAGRCESESPYMDRQSIPDPIPI